MQIKLGSVATEPITLAEARAYLKVDYTDEDTLIGMIISGVREQVEAFTGLGIVARTIEYFNQEIPEEIALPYPEHAAITEVKINDVVSTAYKKTGLSQFIVYPESTVLSGENQQGIYIKYTTSGNCPSGLKLEMLKIIDEKYRNRGNTFEGSISELNENAYANLAKYCLM
jgi:uncharacterized phiE125 gp8 family phage protein